MHLFVHFLAISGAPLSSELLETLSVSQKEVVGEARREKLGDEDEYCEDVEEELAFGFGRE